MTEEQAFSHERGVCRCAGKIRPKAQGWRNGEGGLMEFEGPGEGHLLNPEEDDRIPRSLCKYNNRRWQGEDTETRGQETMRQTTMRTFSRRTRAPAIPARKPQRWPSQEMPGWPGRMP